jgi:hypothetical protein
VQFTSVGCSPAYRTARFVLHVCTALQDTVGNSTWLQTQMTHMAGVTGVTKAFPVHYEVPVGGHVTAEQVRRRRAVAAQL